MLSICGRYNPPKFDQAKLLVAWGVLEKVKLRREEDRRIDTSITQRLRGLDVVLRRHRYLVSRVMVMLCDVCDWGQLRIEMRRRWGFGGVVRRYRCIVQMHVSCHEIGEVILHLRVAFGCRQATLVESHKSEDHGSACMEHIPVDNAGPPQKQTRSSRHQFRSRSASNGERPRQTSDLSLTEAEELDVHVKFQRVLDKQSKLLKPQFERLCQFCSYTN